MHSRTQARPTDAESDPRTIFPLTGEPIGETPWRRWYVGKLAPDNPRDTSTGWHPLTPQSILDEYDWMMHDHGRVTSEDVKRAIREHDLGLAAREWPEQEREWFRAAYVYLKAREAREAQENAP